MVFKLLEWGFLSDEAVVKKKINLDFIRAETLPGNALKDSELTRVKSGFY